MRRSPGLMAPTRYCFDWLEQTEALVNEHQGWIYREELLLNCGTSMSKTIHALPQGATNQNIKDAVLRNHSNLRTVLQQLNTYHQLHQKPDEALQTYNTRYASFFNLAYLELELDNPRSRMHCIHYASSLFHHCFRKKTGTTFPITFDNKHNYNALYDTGATASLINYSAYVSLGQDLDTGYQPFIQECLRRRYGSSRSGYLYFYH